MMLINGEKWACEACVRGHRVSNCQHSDRKLQHINKKGRPVSQCQHCRSMRKSRSSHIKCDCGEKSSKCPHLKTTVEGHKDSCCCNHGGRCTCSHKREPLTLDPVPEADSGLDASLQLKSKSSSRSRRRANTATSEGLLSFDTNGHHKPTYKHAKASQKSGPYQIPRANSMHSSSGAGARSVDNLMHAGNGSDSQGSGSPDSTGCVNSEATSPLMTGSSSFAQLNGQLPPLDLSNIKFPPYVPNSAEYFERISDHDQPIFSAGLSSASVDWSNYEGLEFASKADFAPSSYSQPQSYGGYDYGAEQVPTLTTNTSTSGEVSEAEDILSNPLELEDFDTHYRNNTTLGLTHTGLLTNADLSVFDLDESRFTKSSNKYLATSSSLTGDDSTLLAGASGYGVFASFEDEQSYWMQDFSGLPNCALTESPTTDAPYMYQWDNQ